MFELISIFITGDFAPINRVHQIIESEKYESLFNDLLPLIRGADIAITNLETPLLENGVPIQKTGPNLKGAPKAIEALKFAGFNLITLANNHIMDYGWEGLKSTLNICQKNAIDSIGVGENLKAASVIRYFKLKDSTIAFINAAENEWSTTQGNEPGANPLSEINQYYQIIEARKNADYVILIIHGGHENYGLPSPRMKKLYRFFIDVGADAVVGHHTHCFSGYEVYKSKLIIYSLGNFIFDHPKFRNDVHWNIGCAIVLKLSEKKIDFELVPFKQCTNKLGAYLLTMDEKISFFKEANIKTAVILNDDALTESFYEFIKNQSKMYLSYLEPIRNRLILAGMNRGLLPRIFDNAKKRLLLNLIRTESHRDILLALLSVKNR